MAFTQRHRDTLRDNGLALTMLALFLVSWVGQFVGGLAAFNAERREHGQPALAAVDYPWTSHFWEATFENWESEFLQMTAFILLTAVLYQKGSAESKRIGAIETVDLDARLFATDESPSVVKRGGRWLRLYEHSLGLAFALLFVGSFAGHAISGWYRYCGDQLAHSQPPTPMWDYVSGGQFWFESFQNWQSEFLSILAMVVLSIFLRQRGSPESKPVHAAHSDTGRS